MIKRQGCGNAGHSPAGRCYQVATTRQCRPRPIPGLVIPKKRSQVSSYALGAKSAGPNIWRTSVSPSQPGVFLVKFHEGDRRFDRDRGELVLRLELASETDRDNAPPRHIGKERRTRVVGMMRRRVAPAWCRQGNGAHDACCSNGRMRPTFASGRSRSKEHLIEIFAADGADQPFNGRI